MMTLITAVPGSGKSLFCIGLILKAIAEGRPVYANISGLNIDKCYPAPDDWRDTPEGSLVIYDEAQQPHLYPSTANRGEVKDERLRAMEVHRHTGHDLVFLSQSPSFIHHHIRKLAGEHIHLYRTLGLQSATVYKWQHVVDSPNDRGEQARSDSYPWKFPKEHYKLYKSATVHTHKFRVPKKIAAVLALMVISAAGVIYMASTNEGSILAGPTESASALPKNEHPASGGVRAAATTDPAAKLPPPTTRYDWTEIQAAVPVAGCIYTARKCQCFDTGGQVLKMDFGQCLSAAQTDLPRSIVLGGQGRGGKSSKGTTGVSDANPFAQL